MNEYEQALAAGLSVATATISMAAVTKMKLEPGVRDNFTPVELLVMFDDDSPLNKLLGFLNKALAAGETIDLMAVSGPNIGQCDRKDSQDECR